ncbi:MAG: sensor histidine kinase [Spirosomataceae bacterium]
MKSKFQNILTHVVLFLSFLALIYIYTPQDNLSWESIKRNPNELSNLASFVLMFFVFYLNYYVLVPQLVLKDKMIPYLLLLSAIFLAIYFSTKQIPWPTAMQPPNQNLSGTEIQNNPPPPPKGGFKDKPSGKFDVGRLFVFYLIGIFFTTLIRTNRFRDDLEKDKIETDLRYLKAQINPHFLFNSLNSIYALTISEKAYQSSNALIKLSSMMRYLVTDSQQHFVSLHNELEYIKSYVDLQKLRFDDTVNIDFEIKGLPNGKKIAPLILISFIENAFKYGINPEIISTVRILIEIIDNELVMNVENRKVRVQLDKTESTGLGIMNTKQRLELLYPAKHSLSINETQETYKVELYLNLI